MSSSTLTISKPRVYPLAVSLATTAVAAVALILANKLVGAAGRNAGLADACWQLTAVRATLAASTVTLLVSLRKDHLTLLGLIYAVSLALTHGSVVSFAFAVAAGVGAMGLRHALANRGALMTVLPSLVFVLLLAGPSLVNKWGKVGAGPALADWSPNVGLRLLAATLAAGAITLLWPHRKSA